MNSIDNDLLFPTTFCCCEFSNCCTICILFFFYSIWHGNKFENYFFKTFLGSIWNEYYLRHPCFKFFYFKRFLFIYIQFFVSYKLVVSVVLRCVFIVTHRNVEKRRNCVLTQISLPSLTVDVVNGKQVSDFLLWGSFTCYVT